MKLERILAEIDTAHAKTKQALLSKLLDEYLEVFDENVVYKQQNGKTIGKRKLFDDSLNYFGRMKSAKSEYERIAFNYDNEIFSETLIQQSEVELTVFFIFSKKWKLRRKAIYKWRNVVGTWTIINVEVLEEKVE